jgi:hypothetical protein
MRTAALICFNEGHDWERATDEAGNLAPLFVPAGLVVPSSVDGVVGRARAFAPTQGFHALEAVGNSTRLLRDVTLEAIAFIPWTTTNGTYRLVTRGKGTSSGERELYGLQVVVTGAPSAPVVKIQMRWQVSSGAAAAVLAATVQPPTGWLYIAAVRRWVSTSDVQVDYYLNGEWAGQVTSTDGDITDGEEGTMMIGCDAAAGMPAGSLIDDLRVTREVRTAEEIRQVFRRAFVFPGYGYELIRSLQPPGDSWAQSHESNIQRLFAVAGDALAGAWSLAAQMLDDYLPDRAWAFLDRWEGVTRLQPKANDSIAQRRLRVVTFMRKVHGYTRDKILDGLVDLLDVASTADLLFIENHNTWRDNFNPGTGFPDPRWTQEADIADGQAISIAGTRVDLYAPIASDASWTAALRVPVALRTTIESGRGAEICANVYAFAPTADGQATGVFVWNQVTGDAHLFGFKRLTGVVTLYHGTIVAGVYTEVAGIARPAGTNWLLRLKDRENGLADLEYQVDASDFDAGWISAFADVPTIENAQWTGVYLSDDTAPTTANGGAGYDAFRYFTPYGRVPFQWFIYRDPALGGAPDFGAADQLIARVKPAHTQGAIIEQLTGALYDTTGSTFDRAPYGG